MKISLSDGGITDLIDSTNIHNPKEILGISEDVSLWLNPARLGC